MKPMSRYVSFGVLLAVIIALCVLFYFVMRGFFVPLFLAALLVVIFRPVHSWMNNKCGGREKLAAMLTTASIMLAVLVPIGFLMFMAFNEGKEAVQNFSSSVIIDKVKEARRNMHLDFPDAEQFNAIETDFEKIRSGSDNLGLTQTLLAEIENEARFIAEQEELPWLDAPEPQGDSSNNARWYKFIHDVDAARNLQQRLSDSEGLKDGTVEERIAFEDDRKELRELIKQTDKDFTAFKNKKLGGRTWATIKTAVNPTSEDLANYTQRAVDYLQDKLFAVTGQTTAFIGSLVVGGAIMVLALYFFLLDGPKMIKTCQQLSPLDDIHEQELIDEFGRVSRAVMVATLLSALAQGLLAGIGFYFAGFESIFLLTMLSAVLALVPFVGAAAVWVPASLYLYFIDGNLWGAIALAGYGAIFVSGADNIIKPFILHGQSNLHPLLALLSVLGGVAVLGPIGILVGPMIVAFLQTLLKILERELAGSVSPAVATATNGSDAAALVVPENPPNTAGKAAKNTAKETDAFTESSGGDGGKPSNQTENSAQKSTSPKISGGNEKKTGSKRAKSKKKR